MENLVFAILMLGCDHALDRCEYVHIPEEYYDSREACEDILPLAFNEAENHPVALGDCVSVPANWADKSLVLEWAIDSEDRLKVAVIGPGNAVFGDVVTNAVASGEASRRPAG